MIYTLPNTEDGQAYANSLRDNQLRQHKGALLVREDCDGGNKELLEKILAGVVLDTSIPVDEQPWKPESMVILVGKASAKLSEFEAMLPGFADYFGPMKTISIK